MKLFRKRFFPDEIVELDDEIVDWNGKFLVTKWKAIRQKPDLSHGISLFMREEGIKVSKFYRADNSLVYWYCDIGESIYDEKKDEFMFVDLLADVIVYPNGSFKVVDLAEAAEVCEEGKVGAEHICKMLKSLDYLLEIIYSGEFLDIQIMVDDYENMKK